MIKHVDGMGPIAKSPIFKRKYIFHSGFSMDGMGFFSQQSEVAAMLGPP